MYEKLNKYKEENIDSFSSFSVKKWKGLLMYNFLYIQDIPPRYVLHSHRKIKNTWCDTKQPNKSALSRPVTIKKYDPEFLLNNRGFDAYRPLVAWLIDIWIDILNGKPGCVTRCQPGGVMHLSISAGHAPCHTVTCHTVTLWDIIRVKWLSMMHTCNQRNPENQG